MPVCSYIALNKNNAPSFQGYPKRKFLNFIHNCGFDDAGVSSLENNLRQLMNKCHKNTTMELLECYDRSTLLVFKNNNLPNNIQLTHEEMDIGDISLLPGCVPTYPSYTKFLEGLDNYVKSILLDLGKKPKSIDELLIEKAKTQVVQDSRFYMFMYNRIKSWYNAFMTDRFARKLNLPADCMQMRKNYINGYK